MGNRISIRFVNKGEKSVYLFSHWDGQYLIEQVGDFLREIKKTTDTEAGITPLDRLEPNTLMVNFIYWLLDKNGGIQTGNYYLATNESEGDNGDNGHYDLDVNMV